MGLLSDGPIHIGRSWDGHPLEDGCPCVKAPCGLVADVNPLCGQHGTGMRTIRQKHLASECPAAALGENLREEQ